MTIGGGVPTTGSGIDLGQMSAVVGQAGVVTEDFSSPAGCGVTKVALSGIATIGARSLIYRRRLPDQDASCYLAVGAGNGVASTTLTITVPTGKRIDYIGFYLGSYDPYNYISFTNASAFAIGIAGYGNELNGSQLAASAGAPPLYTSTFLGFDFSISEVVRSIVLRQTDYALEIDNLSYRLVDVFPKSPANVFAVAEPAPIACLALAFAFVGTVRRRATGASDRGPARSRLSTNPSL